MEKRVNESIISRTSFPRSLKYSAIAVAVLAALFRSNAGLSEVATTTTDLRIPSSPKSLSMNSRTSLPRSPISAMTLISALVFLANIPINVDFPTPEPAKIPILCPLPTVIIPSTAFTPRGNTWSIIALDIGSGGAASTGYATPVIVSPSMGIPSPFTVLPKSFSLTVTVRGSPVFSTTQPRPMPSTES